jgi:hypothetical protein
MAAASIENRGPVVDDLPEEKAAARRWTYGTTTPFIGMHPRGAKRMAHVHGRWTTASANGALALQARVRRLAEARWG